MPNLRSGMDYDCLVVGHCILEHSLMSLYAIQLSNERIQRVHFKLNKELI